MNRTINTLGKASKASLRQFAAVHGMKSIQRVQREYGVSSAGEAYELLREAYNSEVEVMRAQVALVKAQQRRQHQFEQRRNQQFTNSLFALGDLATKPTQISKQERQYEYERLVHRDTPVIARSTKKTSALGGVVLDEKFEGVGINNLKRTMRICIMEALRNTSRDI